jgi:molybdopterin converting factor small subunit
MNVLIPGALRSYTRLACVQADGATLADVLADLDRRYPGIRFRVIDEQGKMRPHVRFFVDGAPLGTLAHPLRADGELVIVQALSGG